MDESISERRRLARRLAVVKEGVARAITDEFFLNHPEWMERYGERGRQFCTADACFHVDFLAGAIEAGSPEAFSDYSRWTVRMLEARGIGAHTLDENLGQLEKQLACVLGADEHRTVARFLSRAREACLTPEPDAGVESREEGLGLTKQLFLAAILGGQRQAAVNIVDEALRQGNSLVDIYIDVFAAGLHRVGQLWELNQISVAQEHMATAITQYAIAAAYTKLPPSRVRRGSMIISGVSGEMHQIGGNLVADLMEAHGWEVRFLGTNLPHSSVLSAIVESSATVLGISTTIVANLPAAAELVRSVRDRFGDSAPEIVLGGAAYRSAPGFAQEVGATLAITDLRQVVARFCN